MEFKKMAVTDLLTNLLFKKNPPVLEPNSAPAKRERKKKILPKRDDTRREIKLTIKDLENIIRKQKDDIVNLKKKLMNLQKAEKEIINVQKRLTSEEKTIKEKLIAYSEYLRKPLNPSQKQEIERVLATLEKNLTEFKNAEIVNQKTLNKIMNDRREIKRIIVINQKALSENERVLKIAITAEGRVELEERGIEELEKQYLPEKEVGQEEEVPPPVKEKQPPTARAIPPIGIPAAPPIAPPSLRTTDDDYWKKGRIFKNKKN